MVRKNMRASGKSSLYTLRGADDADDLGSAAAHNHPLHTLAYPAVDLYWVQRRCEPLDRAIPRLGP